VDYDLTYPDVDHHQSNTIPTYANARQAMLPSRNASGVEPPATAATPVTLSSIAMPGAITETEMAMASHRRSVPWASSPVPAPGIRSGLVLAITCSSHSGCRHHLWPPGWAPHKVERC